MAPFGFPVEEKWINLPDEEPGGAKSVDGPSRIANYRTEVERYGGWCVGKLILGVSGNNVRLPRLKYITTVTNQTVPAGNFIYCSCTNTGRLGKGICAVS